MNKTVKTIDVLNDMRAKVANPDTWTTHQFARDADGIVVASIDPKAVRWCAMGAFFRAIYNADLLPSSANVKELQYALNHISVRLTNRELVDANDQIGREQVLEIIDAAIGEVS